jgi:hypothetical protein
VPKPRGGHITLNGYPPDHAVRAREAGYHVEAIQVLHFWIETKLQEWLLLSRHGNLRVPLATVWDTAFTIPLLQAAKALFVAGRLNKGTYEAVCRFNTLRNRVIHGLFHKSYDKVGPKVSAAEYAAAFDHGLRLSNRLETVLSDLAVRGKVGRTTPHKVGPRNRAAV